MMALEVLSNSQSSIRGMEVNGRLLEIAKLVSTKQWVEPESIRVIIMMERARNLEVRQVQRECGSERVDTLSWTTSLGAQLGIMQSSVCAEA